MLLDWDSTVSLCVQARPALVSVILLSEKLHTTWDSKLTRPLFGDLLPTLGVGFRYHTLGVVRPPVSTPF